MGSGVRLGVVLLFAVSCSPRLPPGWTPKQKPVCTQGAAPKVLWITGSALLAIAGTVGPLVHGLVGCGSECSDEEDKQIIVTWSATALIGAFLVGQGFAIDDGRTSTCIGSRKARRGYLSGESPKEAGTCGELQRSYCQGSDFEMRGRYYAQLERQGCLNGRERLLCKASCDDIRRAFERAATPAAKRRHYAQLEKQQCTTCEDIRWAVIDDPGQRDRHLEQLEDRQCLRPAGKKRARAEEVVCRQWRKRIFATFGRERREIAEAAPERCRLPSRPARCDAWDARIRKATSPRARFEVIKAAPPECVRTRTK